MTKPDNFDDTDTICLACLIDEHLRQLAQPRAHLAECCVCESTDNLSIQIGDLAEIVDTLLRRYFRWGDEVHNSEWTDRRGADMPELLSMVLPENFPIPNTLQRAIGDRDSDPRDGGEPFWSDDMRYQEELPTLEAERAEWERVSEELKYERRFFSRRAEQFFGWLFEGIDGFYAPDGNVVRDFAPGTFLYRARRCDSLAAFQRIAADPSQELGPPPVSAAVANRMNAAGVPVFYGALKPETCIAELRAPLRGQLATAQFSLARSVKLLDFQRLEKAHSRSRPSIFRTDYERLSARRRFTVEVHQWIRSPIVPGHEAEYLITQAMSEYLAHVRQPGFDGVVFGSAQDDSGTNVVLFEPKPLLLYVPNSMSFHQVTHVKYSSKAMHLVNVKGKPGFLMDPMAVYDDDER